MFREMRRKRQSLSKDECVEILNLCTAGVLALYGDDGYPYAVPLNYVYCGDKIFFHCAKAGHKIDAVMKNEKASFCVIAEDEVVPSEYLTLYKSVIVFGKIHIIENDVEKREAIEKLTYRYSFSESEKDRNDAIDKDWDALCMLELDIEHISGKQSVKFVK